MFICVGKRMKSSETYYFLTNATPLQRKEIPWRKHVYQTCYDVAAHRTVSIGNMKDITERRGVAHILTTFKIVTEEGIRRMIQ